MKNITIILEISDEDHERVVWANDVLVHPELAITMADPEEGTITIRGSGTIITLGG